ncbi:MAG: hypothetical protein IKH41_06815 [Clostridia bacterium]|nr:hypothetical protein [Clostridia bacterium]
MIFKNDLYDIGFALSIIRNTISEKNNSIIVSKIISVLESEKTDDNQIRKAISSIEGINNELWNFAFHNNVYVVHQLVKNISLYSLLIKVMKDLESQLLNEEYEKAYDLLDCFHCLPTIIADNNLIIPKSFWNTNVRIYREKWDSNF